jgi:cell wall-associated NlpC family hydrolase
MLPSRTRRPGSRPLPRWLPPLAGAGRWRWHSPSGSSERPTCGAGGTGDGGYDCSGLVQAAWRIAGVGLPRTTYEQAHAGTRITRADLEPGDLVFSNGDGHVQLYAGHGTVIQAPHTGAYVDYSPLPPPGQLDAYVRVG